MAQDNTLINAQPGGRWTALHQAVRAGEKSVVEWLLCCRADTNKKNKDGQRAIDLTERRDLVEILLASSEGYDLEVAPQAPTAVGGYLPCIEGGNKDKYYWPPEYTYEQTFQYRRTQAPFSQRPL